MLTAIQLAAIEQEVRRNGFLSKHRANQLIACVREVLDSTPHLDTPASDTPDGPAHAPKARRRQRNNSSN